MRTLIIDGNWNLKRNWHRHKGALSSTSYPCGALIGFLLSLKSVIDKIYPDRVVVFWDGFNAGKLRYDLYKPYKENRKKDWDKTERAIINEGIDASEEEREEFEIIKQKIQVKNILEELFIRQAEVDFIEADDLIAQYVLRSEEDDEHIFIHSRDKDYLQLISDKVSIITPDNFGVMGKKEYEEKHKTIIDNELMFRCFEGDTSDCIKGVKGITRNTLIKNFPSIAREKYTYTRLVEECYELLKTKKLKTYSTIIESQEVLYRNAKLMNLKKPFLNLEARQIVEVVKHGILGTDRDMASAMKLIYEYGIVKFIGEEYLQNFLSSFYSLMGKEKDYAKKFEI